MDEDIKKLLEDQKTQITDLTIRIKRMEDYILSQPNPEDYLIEQIDDDPIYDETVKLVIQHDTVSASFLQRKLLIGYSRAARLIDLLERKGIISHADGSKPRGVLIKSLPES